MTAHTLVIPEVANEHIRKGIDYMLKAYAEPLTLSKLARVLNLNKCYLSDLFRSETGRTFTRLLNEIRIAQSKQLLAESPYSILEISMLVGYNSPNYFIKTFRSLMGTTPLKYRQALRKANSDKRVTTGANINKRIKPRRHSRMKERIDNTVA